MAELKEASTSKPLMWNGLPFRGKPCNLKKTDAPPELDHDVHVKVFDLSNEEHIKEYTEICQKIARAEYILGTDERKYVEKEGKFIVFLKWGVPFYRPPTEFEAHRAMMDSMSSLTGDLKDGF